MTAASEVLLAPKLNEELSHNLIFMALLIVYVYLCYSEFLVLLLVYWNWWLLAKNHFTPDLPTKVHFKLRYQKQVFFCCLFWVIFVAGPEMRNTSTANSCHECNNLTHPLTDVWNFVVDFGWLSLVMYSKIQNPKKPPTVLIPKPNQTFVVLLY